MKLIKPLFVSTIALTGALSFSLPVHAQQETQQPQKISVAAGHNVVDAVDDVRETTRDLVSALIEAEEGLGFSNWEQKEAQLSQISQSLDEMEKVLDQKAEATDSSWLNWMADRDYSVTIKEQVQALGGHLSTIATMLNEADGNVGLQVVVGHNVVDQVDDVRETVGDLLQAISDAGPEWGWFDDADMFASTLNQLQDMEKDLDTKAEMSGEEWETFVASPEYRAEVHGDIDKLANTLQDLSKRISTQNRLTQAN